MQSAVSPGEPLTSSTTASSAVDRELPWLFSARVDLFTFLGSAVLALSMLLLGLPLGLVHSDMPDWLWVGTILMIDAAHVYATGFRVYFDRHELSKRPWLYALTPLVSFALAWFVYREGSAVFWRVLAYVAVFHFVRQQYGWMALYRAKAGERSRGGWWIDATAIYAATLYPLLYWHTHLPRNFWWFKEGDFISISPEFATYAPLVYWTALATYGLRSVIRAVLYQQYNPGKDLLLLTTAICWYVGMVVFNSDFAFTVTNVITHGVPYLVLVYWVRFRITGESNNVYRPHWISFLAILWALAYVEEFLWDVGVWHERAWLFGTPQEWASSQQLLVPLLVVPQITHYVLDGFIWKRRVNRYFERETSTAVSSLSANPVAPSER